MKKIEKLTDEQISLFPKYVKKWLDIGLSTTPCDRDKTKRAVQKCYKTAGLNEPRFYIWADSPLSGAMSLFYLKELLKALAEKFGSQVRSQVESQVCSQVRSQVWSQVWSQVRSQVRSQVESQVRSQVGSQVGSFIYGQHDSDWLSFYNFFQEVCGLDVVEKLSGLMDLAENCNWWAPHENAVVLCEKPIKVSMNERAQRELKPEIWPVVKRLGGWASVCDFFNTASSPDMALVHVRNIAESMIKVSGSIENLLSSSQPKNIVALKGAEKNTDTKNTIENILNTAGMSLGDFDKGA